MKLSIFIKDPDGFSDSVKNAVRVEVEKIEDLSDDERDDLIETRMEKVWSELEQFVQYQENIRIEFDTDAGTATVLRTR